MAVHAGTMTTMIRAMVFDFDGVIADSEPLHFEAFRQVSRTFGVDFDYDEYGRKYIGYDDRDAFRVMLEEAAARQLAPTEQLDGLTLGSLCDQKAEAFEVMVRQAIAAYPGVIAFVRRVAEALPIAIASGATRRDIDLILAELDLAQDFPVIVAADDVARSKPDPQSYRLAVERLAERHPDRQITPATTVAIEDTAAGLESARGAGLWTLGITNTTTAENLANAHRVVDTLDGVTLEQINQWFG